MSNQKVDNPYVPQNAITASPDRRPRARRFLKAFAAAALVIFLLHLFVYKANIGCVTTGNWGRPFNKWPIPSDINVDHCAKWDEVQHHETSAPYSTSTSFELPILSDVLFLLSRGPSSSGIVQIIHSNEVTDVTKVNIVVEYYHPKALSRAKVCLLTRGDGQNGIGIFTSGWGRPHKRQMQFRVVVHLPATGEGPPLQIKNFQTDMPIFLHEVGDLGKAVHFRSISLNTTNMPILVESLHAEEASITSTNSPIEGFFNISSALRLATANAQIKTVVSLVHDGEGSTSKLIATTVNAPIDVSVSLYSLANTGGRFSVSATNARAPITIYFPVAPVDSILSLDAKTSLAPATVALYRTYEGTFSLATSLNRPSLKYSDNVDDPADRGRHRAVKILSRSGGHMDGTVAWLPSDEDKAPTGSVHISTSLSPSVLML